MDYELMQQNPGAYFALLLVSFIITLAAYSAFPLIYAKNRKKVIKKGKYKFQCYLFNFFVWMAFAVINGSASSGGAYILWTWVFSKSGLNKLEERKVLEGSQSEQMPSIKSEQQASPAQPVVISQPRFCRKCGNKLIENSRFCSKCGTSVVEVDQ